MRELGLNALKTVAVHGQIQDKEAQKSEAQKKKKFGIPGARDRKLYGNCCTTHPYQILVLEPPPSHSDFRNSNPESIHNDIIIHQPTPTSSHFSIKLKTVKPKLIPSHT
ncbi:hypothetical protein PGT21_025065 [Puccinia graminis f. sp. tritici]|uniref:Uncharacterized protein n=1 Tax=Puccinia graminis f. sp. tritici TaxID=56615 RepID=A0A5B0R6G0_PUCGR|nr:hypothetical protein PGT21_025065 [Puccinia graminis f. sp. tritici]KAA1120968.1 hypothetical protein PGTUg99_023198 [Puccinia graminis f. sp. tritici]